MRYELIIVSLAAFEVCFSIRDIENEFVPDFACCDDEFLWLFCCAIIYLWRFTMPRLRFFSHWLYVIAYFDGSHYCSDNPMHFLYLLPAIHMNITAFISAIRVEDCREQKQVQVVQVVHK